jgi:hypothetical protein
VQLGWEAYEERCIIIDVHGQDEQYSQALRKSKTMSTAHTGVPLVQLYLSRRQRNAARLDALIGRRRDWTFASTTFWG